MFDKEAKKDAAKRWLSGFAQGVKEQVQNGADWVKENPAAAATIVTLGTGLVTGAGKIINGIGKHSQAKAEQYKRERTVYDHSTGMYLTTKHKLSANEIAAVHNMKRRTGLSMTEVLMKLDLLE